MQEYTISAFVNKRRQQIFYRNWRTEISPRGIMLLVHGFNAHSGYFHHFAVQLNQINIEVYAIDICGRGQSDGERYYISDYRYILEDIGLLAGIARAARPTAPIFLFGHSAGGVFASIYALGFQHQLKGLISESFSFQVPAPAFVRAAVKLLGYLIPHVRLVKLKNSDFSRDISFVNIMNADPLIAREKQPARTLQQLFVASRNLKNGMSAITLPLLILHGTADKVARPSGSKYFMEHVASQDCQLKLYEGHYHDLLNDKDNGIVMQDIMRWLEERI